VKSKFQVKFQAVSESSSDYEKNFESTDKLKPVKKLTTEFTSALPNVGQFSTYTRTVKIGNLELIMIIGSVISSLIVLLCISSIYFRRANIASQKRFNNQLKIIGLDDQCQELPFIKRKSFKLGKEIGQGHFGAVYKAVLDRHGAQKNNRVVAAKELRRDDFGKDNYNKNIRYTRPPTNSEGANYRRRSSANERITRRIFQEASLEAVMHYKSCGQVRHYNIVKFHGYSIDFEASQIHFYLISEYCNSGDLSNFLKKEYAEWGLEEKTIRSDKIDTCLFMSIAAQVASACGHLISQKIVHRDLAVRNVMVNMSGIGKNNSVSDINLHESSTKTIFNKNYRKIGELHSRIDFLQMFHVKLSDFGLAREMNYPRQSENNKGGPDRFYKCPIEESLLPTHSLPWDINEVLSNKERGWTEKVEVWAYGVLLWEVSSCGRVPNPMRGRILGKHHLCSDDCYDLMKVCWRKLEKDRPTFEEIFANASVTRDLLLIRLEKLVSYLEKRAMGVENGIDNECIDESFENSDDFEMVRRTSALEHGVRISQIGSAPDGDFTPIGDRLGVAKKISVGDYQESSVFECETEEDEEVFERPENQIRRDSKIGYVQVLSTLKEETRGSEVSESVFVSLGSRYKNEFKNDDVGYDEVAEYDENNDDTDREPPYQFTDPNTGKVYTSKLNFYDNILT